MGETQSVDVPYEETGSMSPEQQASEVADSGETVEVSERPDYLPEKFNSPEEMAAAYKELEGKLGTPTEEAPAIEGTVSDNDMQFYSDRFAENGKLEESDYAGLEAKGISKDMVDNYVAGQQAMINQHTQTVFSQVGGEERYTAMTQWASETFSAEEVAVFDAAVNSGDMNQTMSAVKGLQARHQMEHGTQPNLMQGKTGGSGVTAYASLAEMKRDMANPKYHQDPAFRETVSRKLANSNIM
tara:strand:- start:5121 stop:5846 length:726 start_codon:yes stop_codon:yes gene_type:complete